MRRSFTYVCAAILGIAIGGYSALAMSGLLPGDRRTGGSINLDSWYGDFTMGSEDASPYFRARIARHGLLALANSEAIYFTRAIDDAGEPFRENCKYQISGGPMPARWWSVTLYNSDNFLPSNTDAALSFDASRAEAQSTDGQWTAIISPVKPEGGTGWISSKAAGNFDLTFRLYVPADGVLDRPEELINAPAIKRLDCEGGQT